MQDVFVFQTHVSSIASSGLTPQNKLILIKMVMFFPQFWSGRIVYIFHQ
uniref:Uncharacterized protein n=1 Tax=Anguilla anguilla TaxID=7936 RepID=A0A0E9WH59_ANGAN